MSLLSMNLAIIFQGSHFSKMNQTDRQKFELTLETYFRKKNRKNDYIDPEEFSTNYGMSLKFVLNLFLKLSQMNVLKKFYLVNCPNCGLPTIDEDINEILECTHCRESLIPIEDPSSFLNNVKYVFKCSDQYKKELTNSLKVSPSSHHYSEVEEDNPISVTNSVTTVLENDDDKYDGLNTEKEMVKELILKLDKVILS